MSQSPSRAWPSAAGREDTRGASGASGTGLTPLRSARAVPAKNSVAMSAAPKRRAGDSTSPLPDSGREHHGEDHGDGDAADVDQDLHRGDEGAAEG
jgi:hypothetical protein